MQNHGILFALKLPSLDVIRNEITEHVDEEIALRKVLEAVKAVESIRHNQQKEAGEGKHEDSV